MEAAPTALAALAIGMMSPFLSAPEAAQKLRRLLRLSSDADMPEPKMTAILAARPTS